jgi:hypothetical protein
VQEGVWFGWDCSGTKDPTDLVWFVFEQVVVWRVWVGQPHGIQEIDCSEINMCPFMCKKTPPGF